MIIHFISSEGKKIETLSIDRVLNKDHFYAKVMQKSVPKASLRPLLNFGK